MMEKYEIPSEVVKELKTLPFPEKTEFLICLQSPLEEDVKMEICGKGKPIFENGKWYYDFEIAKASIRSELAPGEK